MKVQSNLQTVSAVASAPPRPLQGQTPPDEHSQDRFQASELREQVTVLRQQIQAKKSTGNRQALTAAAGAVATLALAGTGHYGLAAVTASLLTAVPGVSAWGAFKVAKAQEQLATAAAEKLESIAGPKVPSGVRAQDFL